MRFPLSFLLFTTPLENPLEQLERMSKVLKDTPKVSRSIPSRSPLAHSLSLPSDRSTLSTPSRTPRRQFRTCRSLLQALYRTTLNLCTHSTRKLSIDISTSKLSLSSGSSLQSSAISRPKSFQLQLLHQQSNHSLEQSPPVSHSVLSIYANSKISLRIANKILNTPKITRQKSHSLETARCSSGSRMTMSMFNLSSV